MNDIVWSSAKSSSPTIVCGITVSAIGLLLTPARPSREVGEPYSVFASAPLSEAIKTIVLMPFNTDSGSGTTILASGGVTSLQTAVL